MTSFERFTLPQRVVVRYRCRREGYEELDVIRIEMRSAEED